MRMVISSPRALIVYELHDLESSLEGKKLTAMEVTVTVIIVTVTVIIVTVTVIIVTVTVIIFTVTHLWKLLWQSWELLWPLHSRQLLSCLLLQTVRKLLNRENRKPYFILLVRLEGGFESDADGLLIIHWWSHEEKIWIGCRLAVYLPNIYGLLINYNKLNCRSCLPSTHWLGSTASLSLPWTSLRRNLLSYATSLPMSSLLFLFSLLGDTGVFDLIWTFFLCVSYFILSLNGFMVNLMKSLNVKSASHNNKITILARHVYTKLASELNLAATNKLNPLQS